MDSQFFSELQKHSQAKLNILNNYVIPWMRKIVLGTMQFGGKCLVIDGFAGRGKYEDSGSDGSPLILLKSAIDFCEQAKSHGWSAPNINLIFIEGSAENFHLLQDNIEELVSVRVQSDIKGKFFFTPPQYPTIKIACVNDEFKNVIGTLLDSVSNLIPSFCFIDPFGFSQTPFELIKRFMRNERAEILLNFIFEETNRFIMHSNPTIQDHISKQFGVDGLDELKAVIKSTNSPAERKNKIVEYYSQQLYKEAGAKHVLNFEIKKNGRTKLILFFATKSEKGLELMKQKMWGQDDTGSYLFDDRKSVDQIEFEYVKSQLESEHVTNLSNIIYEEFMGKENIKKEQIDNFVVVKTIYPTGKLVTRSLIQLETDGRITKVEKIDPSQPRRPKTYKNVHISFA